MAIVLDLFRKPRLQICSICNKPVDLLTATTDEDGNIVHEECHVLKLRQKDAKKPPKAQP